jgi:CheY-like chemotaxis protein
VLRNVLLNARDATPAKGSVRLRADNVVLEAPPATDCSSGDYLRITITDSGSGISADVLPRIFDPYFSTKQRGTQKGMGLGLTICRTIIRKHGGAIAVQSTPGDGTRVVIYLPALRQSASVSLPTASKVSASSPRVLVMDDEELFLEIMDSTLRELGYQVELAADGNKAVKLYEQASREGRPFAIVLLDLTVRGGMGGSQTIKLLRERDPAVRAVLMTGYSHEATFRDYADHGFKAALAKPFSAGVLRVTLADVLQAQLGTV